MVRTYDAVDVANTILRRILRGSHATAFLNCIHSGGGVPRVHGYHLVNSLSLSRLPWISTYEHYLPRWNARSQFGMKLIARTQCRAIIGLSEYARRSMHLLLQEYPDLQSRITAKMHVLHPPQALLIHSFEEKHLDTAMPVFTFVGREFFRKGGREILRAAAVLRAEGLRFRIHIVSGLSTGDYVTGSTAGDVEQTRREIAALQDSVVLHGETSNSTVLAMLRDSHAALLPTFDDTYGFSVLEAQACGTPVITTDVCALGEINTDAVGWKIRLPRDTFGQASSSLAALSTLVQAGIVSAMREIINDPTIARLRGIRALDRIRRFHDPTQHAEKLVGFYRKLDTHSGPNATVSDGTYGENSLHSNNQ